MTPPTTTHQQAVSGSGFWSRCAQIATEFKGTLNQDALAEARKLATWLVDLRNRLVVARKIETSYDRLLEIYRELLHARFTMSDTHKAEAWILRGDWQFKTPKVLTLPDFFPGTAQMQACGEDTMLVSMHRQILREAVSRARQEWIDEGRRLERSTQKVQMPREEIEAWKEERRKAHAEIMAELERKEHYIQRIHTLEAENEHLKQRLAFTSQQTAQSGTY